MKIEKRRPKDARLVLLRMVADSAVCGAIASKWNGELFASRAENLIAGWAVKHYNKFGKAPKQHIGIAFDRWAESNKDEEVTDFTGSFLESLSQEFRKDRKPVSSAVVLDLAADVFDKVQIERINEESQSLLAKGKIKEARAAIRGFTDVQVSTKSGLFIYQGGPVIRNAIKTAGKSLIDFPQEAMKRMFQTEFSRDSFVVFVGPEKVGKSFWLQELSYLGVASGCKVAFFEVGDQSRDQILRRFSARAADRPLKRDDLCKYPISMSPGDKTPIIEFEDRSFDRPMTDAEADFAMKQIGRKYGRDSLYLAVYPNNTFSIASARSELARLKRESNWIPDIVIFDYMDILGPMDPREIGRDRINSTWMAARSLSQDLHCLVLSATQADASSYVAQSIEKGNFSDDKRKNAHPTAALGIVQGKKDKDGQFCRINWVFGRDLDLSSSVTLFCAECRGVANPAILTCFN